ncbi:hypothetical protein C8J57DRAFT_1248968 [Mycena rebaudengoi]|nr:hypothetical protein C8J57DRAFT_1248968 [Mycena rebaudengoi]
MSDFKAASDMRHKSEFGNGSLGMRGELLPTSTSEPRGANRSPVIAAAVAKHGSPLVEYTILATTTARTISETYKVPFLHLTASLCLSITKYIELHSTLEVKGGHLTALLYDIAKFTEDFFDSLRLEKGWKHASRSLAGWLNCSSHGHWVQAQVTGSTLSQMEQMKKDAKEQHEQLVALLETDSDLTNSDHSSVTGTLGNLWNNSSGSFGLLPPCPQIFHGHEAELQDVVEILIQDSACIAILSAGGMGKTSLAATALHDQQVEAKYSHRYFVPCHSSPTCTELVATIAAHIGLEKG